MLDDELTHPSPNESARPAGVVPRLLVLHSSAGKSDAGDLSWLQAEESKVSYHTLVTRMGAACTLVDPDRKAWHAGKSMWQGVPNVNDFSIGLAWSNAHNGKEALTPVQIAVMLGLVQYYAQRYPTITEVVTHAQIAPGRKFDPNESPGFDMSAYVDALAAVRRNG